MDEDVLAFMSEWLKDPRNDALNESANSDVVESIYNLIEEWKTGGELVNSLCLRLFSYCKAEGVESRAFVLQFVPSFVYAYLSAIAQGNKKDVGCIQTLLLAVYNLEVVGEAHNPKVHSFRIPNIAQPSIFHDTSTLATSSLTESALKRLDPNNRMTATFGPHPHLHSFNAENRLPALSALLRVYAHYLSMYSKSSLTETCMAFRRLVNQGYTRHSSGSPRIPLSSPLLVEILHIVYSLTALPVLATDSRLLHSTSEEPTPSMEEGDLASAARQTLEAVERRVELELNAAPLLISSALADSSRLSIKGVSSSPQVVSSGGAGTARAMWKSMITNASFRTKKLPDDITIAQVAEAEAATAAGSASAQGASQNSSTTTSTTTLAMSSTTAIHLGSITEENDEPTGLKPSFRLSELVKKKNKAKAAKSKATNNGTIPSDSAGNIATTPYSVDNNGGISSIDRNNGDVDGKEEIELRRRSNEFASGSTQV